LDILRAENPGAARALAWRIMQRGACIVRLPKGRAMAALLCSLVPLLDAWFGRDSVLDTRIPAG